MMRQSYESAMFLKCLGFWSMWQGPARGLWAQLSLPPMLLKAATGIRPAAIAAMAAAAALAAAAAVGLGIDEVLAPAPAAVLAVAPLLDGVSLGGNGGPIAIL